MHEQLIRFFETAPPEEVEAYQFDLDVYGSACIRDNKHIPLKDVLIDNPPGGRDAQIDVSKHQIKRDEEG